MMEERTNLKFSDIANDINSQADRTIVDVNNPTYEGQQAVQEWLQQHPGYERGSVTNGYLSAPTEPPQQEMPQNSAITKWHPMDAPWNRQKGGGTDSLNQVDQAIEADKQRQEEEKQANRQQILENMQSIGRDFRDKTSGISNALSAWTPVGAAALGGVDRSGEAAGYAAQAAQNQYNAAQNEKLRQANMQQAMDNTIADKMAAAEADSKAKQLARANDEYGAMGLAGNYETSTPDLWKQKQLQNERRDVAAQNLAEVNRNKLMAIGNETNESMTNYATNVEDSQNAYKAALANANGKAETKIEDKSKEDTEKKKEETPTTPSSDAVNTTSDTKETTNTTETQPTGTTSTAVSNQESEGTETVTDQMKAQQIHDRIEALYKESEVAAKNHDVARLKSLSDEYDQLVADFGALPKEVQQIGYRQFDPRHSELNAENAKYDYSAIANAVNDRTL